MTAEVKQKIEIAMAGLALALVTSLTTQIGNCSVGVATKGDVDKVQAAIAAKVEAGLSQCVKRDDFRDELGDVPPAREKRPPVYERLEALEGGQHELANEHALEVRERTAHDVAFWRQLQNGQQRKLWQGARNGALYKWDAVALGKPPSKSADSVLREAGVPR